MTYLLDILSNWLYRFRLLYGLLGTLASPVLLALLIQSMLPGDVYEAKEDSWRSFRQMMKTPKTSKLLLWLLAAQGAQWLMFAQCAEGPLWEFYW